MLPKNVNWSFLAQCDFLAVEKMVQTADRPATKTIEPLREFIFQRKLQYNKLWKETFDNVCRAYASLGPNFQITHDDFGGYRLLYSGKHPVNPPSVLRRNPVVSFL